MAPSLDDFFKSIKDLGDKVGTHFDAKTDALGAKTLDDYANAAIALHVSAGRAEGEEQARLYSRANVACGLVIQGACEAPYGIDPTLHITRIMRLVNHRIEGAVIEIDIEDIMLLKTREDRVAAFSRLFGAIED